MRQFVLVNNVMGDISVVWGTLFLQSFKDIQTLLKHLFLNYLINKRLQLNSGLQKYSVYP